MRAKRHELVLGILRMYPEARDSDRVLVEKCYKSMGVDTSRSWDSINSDINLPSAEALGRCRRRIQNKYPELMPSTEVQQIRLEEEEKWREYSRS